MYLTTDTKRCSTCKQELPQTLFYKRNASPDHLSYICKVCTNQAVVKWKEEHPDKEKEYNERYKNKDIKRYRRMRAEAALARRRALGAKPNARTRDRDTINRRLPAEPLRGYLKSVPYTNDEIAVAAGVTPEFIKRIKQGRYNKVSEDSIDRILKGLGCPHLLITLYPVEA